MAVEAAAQTAESSLSAYERYELLYRAAELLEQEAEEMAQTMTAKQGKPITEARTEVDRALQTLQMSGE